MLDQDTIPPVIDADTIASVAKALAHPARVRIIAFLLSKPGCIGGDIVDEVGLAQSTVSEHLRVLKASGLVQGTIDYPRICYSLNPSALAPIRGLIEAIATRPPEGEAPCCYTPPGLHHQGDLEMTTITVYDPAMCCSTGICGTDVDQKLIDLAADVDWLKAQGVSVRRFGLSREPAEFAANDTIRQIVQDSEGDDLPVFLVDGALKAKARYPARAELAEWAGINAPKLEITEQVRELIALGAAIGASCEPCLKYHTKKAEEVGLTDAQMREAIAVGRMVKEASAKNIYGLADKLIPETTSSCCGPSKEKQVEASGCCGGSSAKSATTKEKAGSCC